MPCFCTEPRTFRALAPAGVRQGDLLNPAAFNAVFMELALGPAVGPAAPFGPALSPLRPSQSENRRPVQAPRRPRDRTNLQQRTRVRSPSAGSDGERSPPRRGLRM